jgi:hypothetical protein
VHGESGQATVEWVALVLLAALVLGAVAAFTGRETDHGLGKLVAERIARAPGELAPATAAATAAAPRVSAPGARASVPPAPDRRAADVSPGVRGVGSVARHAWVVCLGYQRWRYEQEHPIAGIEGLPLGEALGVINDCLNPYDYLLED